MSGGAASTSANRTDASGKNNSIFLHPSQTRLVTIAAHVDHGKTTVADQLIEHNGLISERLVGSLRYLDSDPEEQRRGITIRASAIGLRHQITTPNPAKHPSAGATPESQLRIIHLVDSPGHADFSREVSTSLLACDGVLLVLDVIEGMGSRTHQLLREAREHQLVPLLVLNKMDRLCCELSLTPIEAYVRIRELLETVNAAAAAMLTSAQHLQELNQEDREVSEAEKATREANSADEDEKMWTFDPAAGNVIFASAYHGWAFSVPSLARSLFRQKLVDIKPILLRQYLYGDFKVRGKDKVLKWKQGSIEPTLFAQFALQPIWDIYQAVASLVSSSQLIKTPPGLAGDPDMEQLLNALTSGATGADCPTTLEQVQAILLRTGAQAEESILRALLRRYRPLSVATLDVVCEYLPCPATAASSIRSKVLALKTPPHGASNELQRIQSAVKSCDDSSDAPCVAHVCKFMAIDKLHIRDPELQVPDGSNTIILGLTRVLSGCIRTGADYYVMGPKHTADSPQPAMRTIRCYLVMGSFFVRVDSVPAGHLCAIFNLEDTKLKTATLCDSPHGMPLEGFHNRLQPLVKVNIEPQNAADAEILEHGLSKLELADASVEIQLSVKGERILACLGELHMEQSLLDLKQIYCSKEIELRISDPIVDFGETTDWFDNEMDFRTFFDDKSPPPRQTRIPPYNEESDLEYARHGRMRAVLSGRSAAIHIRVIPLIPSVHEALRKQQVIEGSERELIRIGQALGLNKDEDYEISPGSVLNLLNEGSFSVSPDGCLLVETPSVRSGLCISPVASEVYVLNHSKIGTDDETTSLSEAEYVQLLSRIRSNAFMPTDGEDDCGNEDSDHAARRIWNEVMRGSISAGFQHALRSGPICEEPIRNVLVVVEGVEVAVQRENDSHWAPAKPISGGMVVSALGNGIRCAMLTRPIRLMEGHLKLTLHASLSSLGSLYPILHKRRGKVLEETMVDGTDLILITASIPQAEAFGLAPEIFGKTSGDVTAPEMIFSHWERLDVDPFWIPTTEEEREDFGELVSAGDSSTGLDNSALKYIRQVRRRKGLLIDQSRIVSAAEKQRTLKR